MVACTTGSTNAAKSVCGFCVDTEAEVATSTPPPTSEVSTSTACAQLESSSAATPTATARRTAHTMITCQNPMADSVASLKLVTNRISPSESTAMPCGLVPTTMLDSMELERPFRTVTVLEP